MKESKKLLIGFAIVGGICICLAAASILIFRDMGRRAEKMVQGDPTSVAQVREKVVDFDTPPGYELMAMNIFIYDMVTLTPEDSPSSGPMIMLMQYNGIISGNSEQVEQQLRQSAQQQGGQPGAPLHYVDSFDTEIRGQTVPVIVSEGDYENITMRQWISVFEGKNGMTILMIQG